MEDKSASQPYDLIAWKDGDRRFIEVKGTTGEGASIILTHGEVRHAGEHVTKSVLIVVAKIQLSKVDDEWLASEGEIVCHNDPWIIDKNSLTPTQFRYEMRGGQEAEQ
ncbi:MAG: hypothetical protein CME25_22505 [Gemmatimonadetes bacterium]|nr:hypothetical protein [Gemmatimonadota bacterium]